MTARYYAVSVDDSGAVKSPPHGPHDTYDKAVDVHTAYYSRESPRIVNGGVAPPDNNGRRVMLDLSSIGGLTFDEHATHALLNTDPILRAIFELGRRVGMGHIQFTADQ